MKTANSCVVVGVAVLLVGYVVFLSIMPACERSGRVNHIEMKNSMEFDATYERLCTEHPDEVDFFDKALRCLMSIKPNRLKGLVDAGKKMGFQTNAIAAAIGVMPLRIKTDDDVVSLYLCDHTTYLRVASSR